MRIEPVDPAGAEDFVDVSWRLCAADPRWVPPLRQTWLAELSGNCALARYGRWQMFVATAGNEVRGRIAALVNERLRGPDASVLGQVGYFECIDDVETAAALFEAGFSWLRARGVKTVWGPMNGGAHRSHRLMVRGAERAPFLLEPRNPAWYPRLFEACGFRPFHRWFSYELDARAIRELRARFGRVVAARAGRGTTELIDPSDVPATVRRMYPLLDGFWTGHVGYASLDFDEFADAFTGFLRLMNPRNIAFWNEGGRDLGGAFMYPDWVDEVRALAGDASGWASWPPSPLPGRLVMHTLALLPEARGTVAGIALMHLGLRLLEQDRYQELVVALVVEGLLRRQLGAPTREYALYSRSI